MDHPKKQLGKIFPVGVGICLLLLPLLVYSALSAPPEKQPSTIAASKMTFDYNGAALFDSYNRISQAYLNAASPQRTLAEYYSRRQYLGAPPIIPHKMVDENGAALTCLACHEKGGFAPEFQRHTPLTPHPEKSECRQCHVPQADVPLFVENLWLSVPPPKLGRAYLPGAPPPMAHGLQMRENCIACHVGPAAVEGIRTTHASRGNCRQCHVPDQFPGVFERPTK
ncbi:MAG: nitrate reductase cytochrome c-type subunit [Desulfobacteraceae bacterium]|nr:nitrate reductase cytochrome c-type subunit [Desulfobacteraceae bacterium]